MRYGDGVVISLPFLGVSSLNFGPLATAAFFLGCSGLTTYVNFVQVNSADQKVRLRLKYAAHEAQVEKGAIGPQ